MDKVTRQCPQTTTFLKRKGSRSVSNQGPSAYQPNALPLGQTGSLLGFGGLLTPYTTLWRNLVKARGKTVKREQ